MTGSIAPGVHCALVCIGRCFPIMVGEYRDPKDAWAALRATEFDGCELRVEHVTAHLVENSYCEERVAADAARERKMRDTCPTTN